MLDKLEALLASLCSHGDYNRRCTKTGSKHVSTYLQIAVFALTCRLNLASSGRSKYMYLSLCMLQA